MATANLDKAGSNFDFRAVFIQPAILGVDTFFFLSGFLACRKLIKEVPRLVAKLEGRRAVWCALSKVYCFAAALRWLRLVPLLGFVMLLVTHLTPYLGSGPNWNMASFVGQHCGKSWWHNMLFINNAWAIEDECVAWVWYLANDFQFSLVLPFIAMPYSFGGTARTAAVLLLAALMLMNWTLAIVKYDEKDAYVRPYHRFAPYGFGIAFSMLADSLAKGAPRLCGGAAGNPADPTEAALRLRVDPEAAGTEGAPHAAASQHNCGSDDRSLGYSSQGARGRDADTAPLLEPPASSKGAAHPAAAVRDGVALFRSPALRAACYALSCALLFSCVFLKWRQSYDERRGEYNTQSFFSVVGVDMSHAWGAPMSRFISFWWVFAWGLGLMMLCLPFVHGGGGLVRRVMSKPIWAPFAKLTYGTYMIHIVVIQLWWFSQASKPHFSDFNFLMWWFSFSVMAWVLSYVMWLLVEAPAANIVGLIFKKGA